MRTFAYAAGLALALTTLIACKPPPWKVYGYPAWGFAAAFRTPPRLTETQASPKDNQPHAFQAEGSAGARDLVVAVTDASGTTKTADQVLSEVPVAMAQAAGGTVRNVTYAATGKVVGREFLIDKAGQPSQRVRIYFANGKLYQIVAASPLGVDDPEVTGFLGSFRLLDQPRPGPAASAPPPRG
jgi:hypothetical protein